MSSGIDCTAKLTGQNCMDLRAAGYEFVARYLVPNSGTLAWKALVREEAQRISDAGLRILCIWETSGDRVRGGLDAGASDGARAYKLAHDMGVPVNACLYFAVDYEATAAELDTIAAYLEAAKSAVYPYRVGVYGSYRVVEDMARRGICDAYWQCVAWSYGQVSAHTTVYQHTPEVTVAGVRVDINACQDMDKAGMWSYREEEPELTEKQVREIAKEVCMAILTGADTQPDAWAVDELAQAVTAGITDGSRPKGYGTRQEIAMMCGRTLEQAILAVLEKLGK